MRASRRHSRGVTLLVVLIFLLLITMFSISAFRASTTNLRATQNMTVRQEAVAAAQAAIETVISTPAFQAASAPVASNVAVDIDGDNTNDYTVVVQPPATCTKIRQLAVAELPKNPATGLLRNDWIRCDSGQHGQAAGSGSGSAGLIEGGASNVASGLSFCAETHWSLTATVTDARTGVEVVVDQGVAVPYSVAESQDRCERNN